MSDVLVIIGPVASPLKKADLAAAGFGASAAASAGGSFDLLLVGADPESAAGEAGSLGARSVFTLAGDAVATYTAEAYASAIASFLDGREYRVIAAATSSASKELFPRLAAIVDSPMASDVLAIESIDDGTARFTRAVFVGNLLASVELAGPRVLVTCRASEFAAPEASGDPSGIESVPLSAEVTSGGKKHLALHQAVSERPDLKEADIIVSVGRGTAGPDKGIPICAELADELGAALGATRAVVDAGWLANEFQVGQTGKIVAPDLYIAIGLSGSIQHLAGMRNSKNIVAINKDPEAPIFEVADLGLVADLFEAVPAMIEALRKRKQ